ncbi:MAG: molybdopterin converting factor subunit 1 [Bacillus sp. (in: Bacteria)]|nr:molybdopterin converting factor subunit 1 [Bacillus sp. (in: firmicutes)]
MIKVLLFADLQEKAGKREVEIAAEEITVGEIREQLLELYPQLTNIKTAMPAVNEDYADGNHVVKSGDTVAFIPPVSGG